MLPVLLSIGNLTVSSFGFFLAVAFLAGIFLIWRLSRAWDLDEERVLDLTLLTFLGGLIGARLYFVTQNLSFFTSDLLRIFLIPKYPGFSFWGGFLGGWLSLYFFARKYKLDFWHIADIASIGFLGGLIFADIGCFLGGCSVGSPSRLFFAVPMVGAIGKRFPIQILEAVLLLFVFSSLWSKAIHFHPRGKIISLSLIYIGLVKLLTGFFRPFNIESFIFSITLLVLGMTVFYRTMASIDRKIRRTPVSDVKTVALFMWGILSNTENRNLWLLSLSKSWYNQKTALSWRLAGINKLLRRIRVRPIRKDTTNN